MLCSCFRKAKRPEANSNHHFSPVQHWHKLLVYFFVSSATWLVSRLRIRHVFKETVK